MRNLHEHRYGGLRDELTEEEWLDLLRPRVSPGKVMLTSRLQGPWSTAQAVQARDGATSAAQPRDEASVQRKALSGTDATRRAEMARWEDAAFRGVMSEPAMRGRGELTAGRPAQNAVDEAFAAADRSVSMPVPESMQQAFAAAGADVSGVRVHTSAESAQAANAISARAYTVNQNIHFGAGEFAPGTSRGDELLAHELAHTLQQPASPAEPRFALKLSQPADAAEVEADAIAHAVLSGADTLPTLSARGVQRKILRWADDATASAALAAIQAAGPADLLDIERALAEAGGLTDDMVPLNIPGYAGYVARDDLDELVDALRERMLTEQPVSEAPPNPEPPAVHLHGSGRAHMLDWDARNVGISPESASGVDAQTSLQSAFEAHRDQQLRSLYGEAATLQDVLAQIELLEQSNNPELAQEMRARLFAAEQHAVIATLNVEGSRRYQPNASTYCNIYTYDVVSAMGGYLPRVWWTRRAIQRIQAGAQIISQQEYNDRRRRRESTRDVIAPIYGQTLREMNANALTDWMTEWGDEFGWRQVGSAAEAQEAANSGRIVIILAANRNPQQSGHVAVVPAETSEHRAAQDDDGNFTSPLQSQAGDNNYNFREGSNPWWQDGNHERGGFWVYEGNIESPLFSHSLLNGPEDSAPSTDEELAELSLCQAEEPAPMCEAEEPAP